MKQFLTAILIVSALTSKSQDTIKIPTPVAKQIATELAICDSLAAVHDLTKQQLALTDLKVNIKDSVINTYATKETNYVSQISNLALVVNTHEVYTKELQKQHRALKVKLLFTKITLSAVIGALTYLYIIK